MFKSFLKTVGIFVLVEGLIVGLTFMALAANLPMDVAACSGGVLLCFPPSLMIGVLIGFLFAIIYIIAAVNSLAKTQSKIVAENPGQVPSGTTTVPTIMYLVFGVALPLAVIVGNLIGHSTSQLDGLVLGIVGVFLLVFLAATFIFFARMKLIPKTRDRVIAAVIILVVVAVIAIFFG